MPNHILNYQYICRTIKSDNKSQFNDILADIVELAKGCKSFEAILYQVDKEMDRAVRENRFLTAFICYRFIETIKSGSYDV